MLDPGLTLGGRYTLRTLIARGGMGEVWSAEDTVLARRVAVKVLLPNLAADPGFAARFRAEAQAMAALSDPGIVEIYDYGQADGIAYLVMQFVEGESLLSLVRRVGPLAPARAMRLLAQAADAIHAAHLQGIVHRDVKPANLLLRPDGRLALTDFGIARIVAADRLTAAGEIFGTASYLAPEQVTGSDIGPATDVYALGVVAYEMLTQHRPFAGDTPFSVALKHVHEQPPELPPSVPEPVRALVMRALAKDPAQRWPSAAALAKAASAAIKDMDGQAAAGAPAPANPGAEAQATAHPALPRAAAEGGSVVAPFARRRRPVPAGVAAALSLVALAAIALSRGGAGDPLSQGPEHSPPVAASGSGPAGTTQAAAPVVGTTPTHRASPATPGGAEPSDAPSNPPAPDPAAPASPAASPSPQSTARTVPAMYGWREVEVTAELKRLGLVADISYRATPDKCHVLEQTPVGGTVLAAGSTVEIVIATATGVCKVV
ncbi:serine/threonine-protein kinase [Catellatospora sichuanensis]|uniref:serine/threonine-protein kinase n=1 Tax=Catellatospora sichuanensis TaxID=1969805 RepID=UPI001182EEC7|nr:serine/threonine-protein kinase [Catellatospora sichuanensis]